MKKLYFIEIYSWDRIENVQEPGYIYRTPAFYTLESAKKWMFEHISDICNEFVDFDVIADNVKPTDLCSELEMSIEDWDGAESIIIDIFLEDLTVAMGIIEFGEETDEQQ